MKVTKVECFSGLCNVPCPSALSTVIFIGTLYCISLKLHKTENVRGWGKQTAKYRTTDLLCASLLSLALPDFFEDAFEYIGFLRNQRWIKIGLNWILSGQAHHKNNTRKNWKVNDLLTPRKQSDTESFQICNLRSFYSWPACEGRFHCSGFNLVRGISILQSVLFPLD